MAINILDHENVTSPSMTKEKSIMSVQNSVFDLYCFVITTCAFLKYFTEKYSRILRSTRVKQSTNHALKTNKISPMYISIYCLNLF